MCDHTNEQDSIHAFLIARIAHLEYELEECALRSIEARNPGIDIEEVRRFRASQKESMENS